MLDISFQSLLRKHKANYSNWQFRTHSTSCSKRRPFSYSIGLSQLLHTCAALLSNGLQEPVGKRQIIRSLDLFKLLQPLEHLSECSSYYSSTRSSNSACLPQILFLLPFILQQITFYVHLNQGYQNSH